MGKMQSFGIRTQVGLTVLMMSSDRDNTESTDPHPSVFVFHRMAEGGRDLWGSSGPTPLPSPATYSAHCTGLHPGGF